MSRLLIHRRHVGAVTLVVALVAGLVVLDPATWLDDDEAVAAAVTRDTAAVMVSTLTTSFSADGTLAYRSATTATVIEPPGEETTTVVGAGRGATTQVEVTAASMVVTELVAEGQVVEPGDVLWRLGNEPTILLEGTAPAFRDLAEGDEGDDVLQLESALVALGYDPYGTVTVDDEFTAMTEAMVERWQAAVGADVDGIVHHGSIVFADGPSRVGDTDLTVGGTATDGQTAFVLQAFDVELSFTIEASDRETLAVGDTVRARGETESFSATVVSMTVTETGGATVVAAPDDDLDLTSDEIPVEVSWEQVLATDVVTVPAEAIVRTDDQRTWVEVRDSDRTDRWVEVTVGQASGGRVEAEGELSVDDLVIVP